MGGAGTLSLLLALTASPRETEAGLDFAQFKRAQDDFVTANVKGDFETVQSYFSPKYVFIRNDSMMQRADFLVRVRNQFAGRVKIVSGDSEFKSVVTEMNGYSIDVKRHYVSEDVHLTIGTGALHQYGESKESWAFQGGRWVITSTKVVSRRAEWHMHDGSVVDVTYGRR